jgi:hypothetical protein
MFGRVLKDGLLERWQPSFYGGQAAFDTSNRYFSSRRQNPFGTSVPFHEMVDPEGILADMGRNDLMHCEENEVNYFKLITDANGNERYTILASTQQLF